MPASDLITSLAPSRTLAAHHLYHATSSRDELATRLLVGERFLLFCLVGMTSELTADDGCEWNCPPEIQRAALAAVMAKGSGACSPS